MENKIEDENKIINKEEANNDINKIYKFITKENREIIGCLKAFQNEGNFYLTDCVEVFNKKSDNFATNELFENSEEHQFYYETENFQYQYITNCIFPIEEIADILTLKEDIFNKYKKMLEQFYEEQRLKDLEQKQKDFLNQQSEMMKENIENKEDNKDINDEILENIKNEGKKKKKRRKKKK